MSETVRMVRDAGKHPDSHEAIIGVEAIADFEAAGWRVDGDRPGDMPSTQGTSEAQVDADKADPYPHLSPAQEAALDRDGDGKPGGSRRGRPRKSVEA